LFADRLQVTKRFESAQSASLAELDVLFASLQDFLAHRRSLLAERMNAFIQQKAGL
jgi:hypothetical protein